MSQAIARWGNSLAVRLPRHVVQDANLSEGAAVEVRVRDGAVVITPARRMFRLDELLAGETEATRHPETDWGEPRGKEVW